MNPTARRDHLLTELVQDELIVYDEDRQRAHTLNRSAALVWQHCDGQTSIAELADILHQELNLPAEPDVVLLALNRLERVHLLVQPAEPETSARPSRRQVLQKLGLASGIAVLLPVIKSAVVPTPALAFSF